MRKKIWAGAVATLVALGAVLPAQTVKAAGITVDGDPSDWSGIAMQSSDNSNIAKWAVAQDDSYVYFYVQENGGNEWGQPISDTNMTISYGDGSSGGIRFAYNIGSIKDGYYGDISGEIHAFAPSDERDKYEVEFAVPQSFFSDSNYTISYCGASVSSSDIMDFSGGNKEETETQETETQETEAPAETETQETEVPAETETQETEAPAETETQETEAPAETETQETEVPAETESQETEAPAETETPGSGDNGNAYNGITIDGNFSDWKYIAKTPVNNGAVVEAAMIFDGDWVYIYIKDEGNGCATWSGAYSNGNFTILTDTGRNTVFKLGTNYIGGVDGAEVIYSNNQYEIAIPASAVKQYNSTISFGYYMADEMIIKDVANLQGGGGSFGGITYDGLYGDWDHYPHQLIQYATPGTHIVDDGLSEGALYTTGTTLYGHVKYIRQNSNIVFQPFTLRFNQDSSKEFNFRLISKDANGKYTAANISNLAQGTYEFYLGDMNGWQPEAYEGTGEEYPVYGFIYVTIGSYYQEMEFSVNLEKVAEKLGLDVNELQVIQAQYINIGTEWVTSAGTSTGPAAGIVLSCGAVVCVLADRKRKMRKA